MNRLYTFHPDNFAFDAIGNYYSYMASKGWILEKRGTHLSRFVKGDNEALDYLAQFLPQRMNNYNTSEEKLISFYAEHGWTYVTSSGDVYIFSAPEERKIPEMPEELFQQKKALNRLKKQNIISAAMVLILMIVFASILFFSEKAMDITVIAKLYKKFIEETAFFIACSAVVIFDIIASIRRIILINSAYKKIGTQKFCECRPKSYKMLFALKAAFAVFAIFMIILVFADYLNVNRYTMPDMPEYPYIQISEFSVSGQRLKNPLNNEESTVTENKSLLSQHWHTQEFTEDENGDWVWFYQDVYILNHEKLTQNLVKVLMRDAVFVKSEDAFIPVEVPGLDSAYITDGCECVAVKGNITAILEYPFESRTEMINALAVFAEKWK